MSHFEHNSYLSWFHLVGLQILLRGGPLGLFRGAMALLMVLAGVTVMMAGWAGLPGLVVVAFATNKVWTASKILAKKLEEKSVSVGRCWPEMIEELCAGHKVEAGLLKRLKKRRSFLALSLSMEAHEELSFLKDMSVFYQKKAFFGFRHVAVTFFDDINGESAGHFLIKDIPSLPEDIKRTLKWTAPPAALAYTDAALGAAAIAIIGNNQIGNKNAFPKKTMAELKTLRDAEWALYKNSFEFFEIDGKDEVHLPSTATGFVAIPTQSSGDLFNFLTCATTARLNWPQSLTLTMILTNGHTKVAPHDRTYFKCFDVKGPSGHNVYFSFPGGLSNASVWHAMGGEYSKWARAGAGAKNLGKCTMMARLMVGWGAQNMCATQAIENAAGTGKGNGFAIDFTSPGISHWSGVLHEDILRALYDDYKMVVSAVVAQAKANAILRASGQKGKALEKIPEGNFKAFSYAGVFKKRQAAP